MVPPDHFRAKQPIEGVACRAIVGGVSEFIDPSKDRFWGLVSGRSWRVPGLLPVR